MSNKPQQRLLAPAPAPVQPQVGPATYSRAPKGKACLNCRRRKLKCDCAHPACNQCLRFGREKDCEYTEKDQKSRTEILEGNISVLQNRIRELENAANVAGPGPSSAITGLADWTGLTEDIDFGDMIMAGHTAGDAADFESAPQVSEEPSYTEAQNLIHAFLPYASDVGFFLNTSRFLEWAGSQISDVVSMFNPYAACPCPRDELCPLLEVVYLWGSILTTDAGARQKQSTFLNRALRRIVDAERIKINAGLGGQESPRSTLHLIQSHVLLANYFFNAGQFSQGRRHTADAVSLVVSHRFHKIRSPRPHDASHMHLVRASDTDMVLPLPADLAEEGERTHAFWQVYVLDKTWATVLCHPSLLVDDGSPETEIDTPWPLAMNDYVEGILPPGYGTSGQTVQNSISMPYVPENERLSPLALRARAVAFLYRAAWFASCCSADPSMRELHTASFELTDTLLDGFVISLPSLETSQTNLPPDVLRHILVTHCITRLAMCQLHYPFFEDELKSATKCMSASKAVICAAAAVPADSLTHIDPILPVLMTMAPRVIAAELMHFVPSNLALYKRPVVTSVNPYYLAGHIDEAIELIGRMNNGSRLTALQMDAVSAVKSTLAGAEMAGA